MAEVFQQYQGFWLLFFFVLFLVAGFYVVQGLRRVAELLV